MLRKPANDSRFELDSTPARPVGQLSISQSNAAGHLTLPGMPRIPRTCTFIVGAGVQCCRTRRAPTLRRHTGQPLIASGVARHLHAANEGA